ncbi:MAG: 16S rRNA processing protein RimM [Oscillospiraceae bacterium]|nr:16S rRNA processing protein RimM [Oscillospiraceae bacterium]
MEKQQYIEAGRIVNTHGVAGEVKIEVWLDSPQFMKRFRRLYIDGSPRAVLSARVHKSFLLCALEGVNDVNAAMALKGRTVYIDRADAHLPAGTYFLQDIIGSRVVDEQGRALGVLTEVLERPASNIYVVKGETEHLIPAIPEFVMSTDLERGVITVRLIEGM